jgi:OOP family OmpA-OmpF porin
MDNPHQKGLIRMAKPTAYQSVYFEYDSSTLRTSSYLVLDAIIADLRSSKKLIYLIGYYSSNEGNEKALLMSRERAEGIKTYLVNWVLMLKD